jgi:uncharacterized membrane protein
MASPGYKLLLLLHILSVIVAFGPAFAVPVMNVRARKLGAETSATLASIVKGNTLKIYGPATVLAGVFGCGLVGMSEKVWKFDQAWVSVALLLWIFVLAVQFGLLAPAEKRAAGGDAGAERMQSMFTGIQHVLLLGLLVVMIWKPGLGA